VPRSKVYVNSVGMTTVADHWESSILDLAVEASRGALKGFGKKKPDQIIVGNMFSAVGAHQEHLGAMLVDGLGLSGLQRSRWNPLARLGVRRSTWGTIS